MLRASRRDRMPVNFALTVWQYQRQAKLTVCQTQGASSFPARRPFVFLAHCFSKSQGAVALRPNNNGLLARAYVGLSCEKAKNESQLLKMLLQELGSPSVLQDA
jgi:hypothetical protein